MTVSFIHTADWQIGKQFGKISGDIAALLRESRFSAIKKIARMANEHHVDAILVAGDVFEANEVSDTTLRRALNEMCEYKGPWVLLPGNHDPALAQSVWTRIARLPEKTENIILATEPKPIFVADGRLVIFPSPLKRRHEFNDLTEWYENYNVNENVFKVGLAHGSMRGFLPESAEIHNMISSNRAETASLDYLALGDWHGQLEISPKIWYAGTPEQDRFHDNDSGNALLVSLTEKGNHPAVVSMPIGTYRWHSIEFQIYSEADIAALNDYFLKFVEPKCQVVRLSLKGNVSLALRQEVATLISSWEARLAMLEVDDCELKQTPSEDDLQYFSGTGFLGMAFERLLSIRDDRQHDENKYAERAIQLLWQQLQSNEGSC